MKRSRSKLTDTIPENDLEQPMYYSKSNSTLLYYSLLTVFCIIVLTAFAAFFSSTLLPLFSSSTLVNTLPPQSTNTIALNVVPLHMLPQQQQDEEPFLRFAILGDYGRRGNDNQTEVADAMSNYCMSQGCDFIVGVGDNFYKDGVSSVSDPQFEESFEHIYGTRKGTTNVTFYQIFGNHCYRGNPTAQIQYSHLMNGQLNKKRLKAKHSQFYLPHAFYSFVKEQEIGASKLRAQFIATDTNPFISKYYNDENMNQTALQLSHSQNPKQLEFIESQMKQYHFHHNAHSHPHAIQWRIAIGHHPFYSSSPRHAIEEPDIIRAFSPLFQQHKVGLYLCGHDHNIQHLKKEDQLTHYIISGGGSAVRFDVDPAVSPYLKHFQQQSGFVFVQLGAKHAQVKMIDLNGRETSSFMIMNPSLIN